MLVAGVDLIGPRSDFVGFARKKIPFLFFSHATHKDYHGMGDRPELLDYDSIAAGRGPHRTDDCRCGAVSGSLFFRNNLFTRRGSRKRCCR